VDLVVLHVEHPPEGGPLTRAGYGLRVLIGRGGRPVLATPGLARQLVRPLLAYDGSRRAQSALIVATYLAGRWGLPLKVVCASSDPDRSAFHLDQARSYLEDHGLSATYVSSAEEPTRAILGQLREGGHDLLVLGSYRSGLLVSAVTGSVVDELLNRCTIPMLFCP
jgi:nucleotide-binding universal stress UspA family protein